MAVKTLEVKPFHSPPNSSLDFGAEINNVNLERLSEEDFKVIRNALYNYHVVVLKNQAGLSPKLNMTLLADSILLPHPHHKIFHKTAIPEEDDLAFTRFYRWHIDAALYALNPPKVTSLMAVKVPAGRRQTLRYDDGTDEEMDVPLGTTAFVSGQKMYNLLSEEDKEFVRGAKVEYAPHPYIWMSPAKSRSTGLGMVSDGAELPLSELPPVDDKDIKILPMCWKNPVTGNLALQIHPSAIKAIHLPNGEVMTDLKEVRDLVYRLQRPAISPQFVYPHDWVEGDLVLFNNQGVLHSVVGAFSPEEKRLFRQCNMASSEGVMGPDGKLY